MDENQLEFVKSHVDDNPRVSVSLDEYMIWSLDQWISKWCLPSMHFSHKITKTETEK